MRCIAQSNEMPLTIQVERRNNIYDIWLRQNIHEVEVQDEQTPYSYYEYDEAYMQNDRSPEIGLFNFDEWFDKASVWHESSDDNNEEDFILELAADHEERLCLLEMLTEA